MQQSTHSQPVHIQLLLSDILIFDEVENLRRKFNLSFKINPNFRSKINFKSLNRKLINPPQLTVLSFGAGQDSTTILNLLIYNKQFREKYAPNDLLIIMSNTDNEHPSTYLHIEKMQKLAALNNIEFIFLNPIDGYHSEKWLGLKQFYKRTSTCGSKAFRKSCTDNLKIKPIYRFLENYLYRKYELSKTGRKKSYLEFAKKYGKILMMIGIAAGEESRVAKRTDKEPKWRQKSIEMSYPLIDLGMDRELCQQYIKSLDQDVPMPSNCMICPYLSDIELLWLNEFYPDEYEEWVIFEQTKIDKYEHKGLEPEKNLGVWGNRKLPEILERAKQKYNNITRDQLMEYKMSHGHCVRSKY